MRIMGLDYGTKTVGVAVSDPLGITAQAVETITRKEENKLRKTCARIEALIAEYGVERIVLGFPKRRFGRLGIVFADRIPQPVRMSPGAKGTSQASAGSVSNSSAAGQASSALPANPARKRS